MRVNFLGASDGTPLSKTFEEIASGTFRDTSYPHVAKFNSIERIVDSIEEFHAITRACAAEGLCLLKGELDQPLLNESRAGHTETSTPTSWLCLDVDYNVTDVTPQQWLAALSPEFKDVTFLFQASASMRIKLSSGWRGHFFILLDSPQPPQVRKQWLIQRNLVCPSLQTHIGLSASGGALTYPLDITTCQNDKLIYIAPPRCIGFHDPMEQRFLVVPGKYEHVSLDFSTLSAAANQAMVTELINKKRKAAKLPKKTFKTVNKYGNDVLVNPDPVTVTGKKEAREFVYLNLNGGDSWGYFFPVDNPEIVFNFKGEPCMLMRDVDKEIYSEYAVIPSDSSGERVPFGFLWPNDDTYYRGFANQETGELSWIYPVGSKGKLRDFFVQNGQVPASGWVVPEWQMVFDPTTEGRVNFAEQYINTYKTTQYVRGAKNTESGIPPTIDRIITSVCVDEETKQHFLNWLASIFQTRQKTNTAWIFQGVQGTGKGVLFSRILVPLIGAPYCHEMTMDRLDDDFNAYLSENILLFIDEAKITDSKNGDRLLNRIKNLVTEPEQHIRGMRRNAVTRSNYSNVILASNYDEIIPMEASDRRFNVAPRQEKPLQLEYDDIITIQRELPSFANYLHSYEVDNRSVRTVLLSEARASLIALSETTVTSFFHAITHGDLAYFTQYLDDNIKGDLEGIRYHDYSQVVRRWYNDSRDSDCSVSRDEMRTCYQYLQNTNISTTKFSRMCAKYGLQMKSIRLPSSKSVTRGITGVVWKISEEETEFCKSSDTTNVIKIKERK